MEKLTGWVDDKVSFMRKEHPDESAQERKL